MNSEKKMKVLCTILLSIFLVISGVFIASKCAFTGEEPALADSDTEATYNENEVVLPVSQKQISISEIEDNMFVQGEYDLKVIPDKYNTGCHGDLYKVNGDKELNGITTAYSGGSLILDFYYRNQTASEDIVLENYDFSDYPIAIYHEDKIKNRKIKIIFNNCKFSCFSNGRPKSDVFSYEFNDCSFTGFHGSNASFNRCRFGGSYNDGLTPFSSITVKDSYFADFTSDDSKGSGLHSDGTQMYGYSDSMVKNVLFSNCRFEVPAVQSTTSTSSVNACIMLQLEYNDGDNINFEDCILNGGGYTIYAWTKFDNLKLTNVNFKNIRVGDAKLYGNIYPKIGENVVFKDVTDQDALYVSSVWNDGSKIHVIVSNDTDEERILRVVSGTVVTEYVIKPCLGGFKLRYENFDTPFEEFPFDIDISIDSKADYVVCFDVTDGNEKQIRYVSFNENRTYYRANMNIITETIGSVSEVEDLSSSVEEYLIQGECGKDISYYLDSAGVLKIEGKGIMNNYDSIHPAPWMEYSEKVVSLEISDGITQIGSQAFRNLKNIKKVTIPKTVTRINSNAFIGCGLLSEITLYSGLTSIDKYVFHGTGLVKCTFYGSETEWNAINIKDYNNPLLSCKKTFAGNQG